MHRSASRLFLCLVVGWSLSALAHKNTALPASLPENCNNDLTLENPDSKIPFTESVMDVVKQKIAARVSQLQDQNGVLISDEVQDDGEMYAKINEGITRLFMREVAVKMNRDTISEMTNIAKAWAQARRVTVEAEQNASKALRSQKGNEKPKIVDGIFDTPFLSKYPEQMRLLWDSLNPEVRSKLGVTDQESRLKTFMLDDINKNLSTNASKNKDLNSALYKYTLAINQTVKDVMDGSGGVTERYLSGATRDPDFALLESALKQRIEEFVGELQQRYPLQEASPIEIKVPQARDYVELRDGKVGIWIDKAVATFEKEIGSLVLRAPLKQNETPRMANVIELHGTGSNRSNVASWLTLFPKTIQSSFDPYAINLPGSTGTNGIGMNSIRSAEEIDAYLRLVYRFVEKTAQTPDLPTIVLGRSMGATAGAMNMFYGPRVGKSPGVDVICMMSFSNPETIRIQTENLLGQLRKGQVQGVIKSALDHAVGLTDSFQADLKVVRPKDLSLLEMQTQDIGIFFQGAADEDGVIPGSAPGAIIHELEAYRDKYFPFAHVYPFEAPQLKYGDAWWEEYKISPNDSEGTHFLLSQRANITNENRGHVPMSVPEIDLPKLDDQQFEGYETIWADLDYQIDLSPITDPARRAKLREQRLARTGHDEKNSYLRWYVENVVNPKQKVPREQLLTLDQIIANKAIQPGRQSGMYGRVKKTYYFFIAEQKRVQGLLAQ